MPIQFNFLILILRQKALKALKERLNKPDDVDVSSQWADKSLVENTNTTNVNTKQAVNENSNQSNNSTITSIDKSNTMPISEYSNSKENSAQS
jgi:hypothetical protein